MTRRRSDRRRYRLTGAGLAVLGGALGAAAAPAAPGDPEPPLVLGDIAGFGATAPAMTTTTDGATWVAWISNQCFGELRVQRIAPDGTLLAPGGLAFDLQDDCATFHAALAPCPDGSVVAASAPHLFPVRRIGPDGSARWGDGVLVSPIAAVGGAACLPGGDVLLSWHEGSTMLVGRYGEDGAPVWSEPAAVTTITGPNKRILGLVGDDAGGAYVIWDEPFSYVRSIWCARITGAGAPAWGEPFNVVPIDGAPSFAGSSRHTDPVAVTDGRGGVVLVWTFGAEQPQTPVPLLMQVIRPDGTRAFEAEGRRVSLPVTRQYDAVLARDAIGGDAFVAWRDGGFDAQELRVQRMSLQGERTWGDDGVAVTALGLGGVSHFDASWHDGTLSLVVADVPARPGDPSVVVHRVDATGVAVGAPAPVSGPLTAGPVRIAAAGDAATVAWYEEPADGLVLASRICDGPCPITGDTNDDGAVNIDDVINVILDWGTDGSIHGGDVNDDGIVDVDDVVLVILSWTA